MSSEIIQKNSINMNEIVALIGANSDSIEKKKANAVVGRYYAGHHRTVFDLTHF